VGAVGIEISAFHWLGTSLIQQLVATAQAAISNFVTQILSCEIKPFVGQDVEFCAVCSAFLWLVSKFRATSKNHDLLTFGDPDINPVCMKYLLLNTGVYAQENEWSFVNLFHTVPYSSGVYPTLKLGTQISSFRQPFKCTFLPSS